MLFNSLAFLVFAPLFFLGWKYLKKYDNARWLWLVVCSFFFYGWWSWEYCILVVISGLIDFYVARAIQRFPRGKRFFLVISLVGNLGILIFFKYSRFLLESFESAAAYFGFSISCDGLFPADSIVLPIGISFYTFQSMSYTIDVYFGKCRPVKNPLHFFSYLVMFPQLVAGPIIRAKDLLPQLERVPDTTEDVRWHGTRLICWGFFKKCVIADNLAPIVNHAFNGVVLPENSLLWWGVMVAFAFQIYCDFSGYSDIARGLGNWMGFEFPVNFKNPYWAKSLRDFWRRWHISLSTWFRDYVYIPLGGSKSAWWITPIPLMLTFILSGVWHGAAWHFVVWGAIHGTALGVERQVGKILPPIANIYTNVLGWCYTFIFVLLSWVFFRAESIEQAWTIIRTMFTAPTHWIEPNWRIVGLLVILLLGEFVAALVNKWQLFSITCFRYVEIAAFVLILAMAVFLRGTGQEFIYFQF